MKYNFYTDLDKYMDELNVDVYLQNSVNNFLEEIVGLHFPELDGLIWTGEVYNLDYFPDQGILNLRFYVMPNQTKVKIEFTRNGYTVMGNNNIFLDYRREEIYHKWKMTFLYGDDKVTVTSRVAVDCTCDKQIKVEYYHNYTQYGVNSPDKIFPDFTRYIVPQPDSSYYQYGDYRTLGISFFDIRKIATLECDDIISEVYDVFKPKHSR